MPSLIVNLSKSVNTIGQRDKKKFIDVLINLYEVYNKSLDYYFKNKR